MRVDSDQSGVPGVNTQTFYEQHKTDLPHIDQRLKIMIDLVESIAPASVYDAACGRGALLRALRDRHPSMRLVGGDISKDSVDKLCESGIEAVVANVEHRLPFSDEEFECATFGEVIEHLIDPDSALQELSRIIRRDGWLVLSTPNLASWFNRILLACGVQPIFTETSLHVNLGRKVAALGQWKPTQGHLKVFTLSALREMLAANGFAVERILGAPFPQPSPAAWLDRRFAAIPSLASNFVVLARNGRTLAVNYRRLPGWLE